MTTCNDAHFVTPGLRAFCEKEKGHDGDHAGTCFRNFFTWERAMRAEDFQIFDVFEVKI